MDVSEPMPKEDAVAKFLADAFPQGFNRHPDRPRPVCGVEGRSAQGELWIDCGPMIHSIAGAIADRVTGKLGVDVRAVVESAAAIFVLVRVSETHYIIITDKE